MAMSSFVLSLWWWKTLWVQVEWKPKGTWWSKRIRATGPSSICLASKMIISHIKIKRKTFFKQRFFIKNIYQSGEFLVCTVLPQNTHCFYRQKIESIFHFWRGLKVSSKLLVFKSSTLFSQSLSTSIWYLYQFPID